MRPPGYRPPYWRPPAWRPPVYRPPYVRPPHYRWGRYFWHPVWTWYHTAVVAGATLVYIDALPDNGSGCEELRDKGETIYVCNGVVYRASLYKDEKVYEVVSSDKESQQASAISTLADNDDFVDLKLMSPMLRGDRVRTLQTALETIGFEVGTIDGVFGRGTDQAVRAFQEWYGLPITGVVDLETAKGVAAEYTAILAPAEASSTDQPDTFGEPESNMTPGSDDAETQNDSAAEPVEPTDGSNSTRSDAADSESAGTKDSEDAAPATD